MERLAPGASLPGPFGGDFRLSEEYSCMGPVVPGSGSPGLEDIMRHLRWILVPLLLLVASSAWAHDAKMQTGEP